MPSRHPATRHHFIIHAILTLAVVLAITFVALSVGIATFIGVAAAYIWIRTRYSAGFDPSASRSKIEASVVLAAALGMSTLAFLGVLVLLG